MLFRNCSDTCKTERKVTVLRYNQSTLHIKGFPSSEQIHLTEAVEEQLPNSSFTAVFLSGERGRAGLGNTCGSHDPGTQAH